MTTGPNDEGFLHRDVSLHNILLPEIDAPANGPKGYLIDYDYAVPLSSTTRHEHAKTV